MNRILLPAVALALLVSCSTQSAESGGPPIVPTPAPLPSGHGGSETSVTPQPPPVVPESPPGTPPKPQPRPDGYPPCTESRRDICTQVAKRPVDPDHHGGDDHHHHPFIDPIKPLPDPVSDCFVDQPYCAATGPGMGAFGRPAEFRVGQRGTLQFAVASDDGVLIQELKGGRPAAIHEVDLGRCMRVTLEAPDGIAIAGGNGVVQRLPDPLAGASWGWSVEPRRDGLFAVRARVEVLESVSGRCTAHVLEDYTKIVPVDVRVTVFQRLVDDIHHSKTPEDKVAAVFRSWETMGIAFLSLLLLGLLIGGGRFLMVRRRLGRFNE